MNSNTKILAYGDSYLTGYGVPVGEDFLSILEKKLPITIQRYGQNGGTAQDTFTQIKKKLPEVDDVILLHFGINDCLRSIPVEETVMTAKNILSYIQKREAKGVMILPGIPPILEQNDINYLASYRSFQNKLTIFRKKVKGYDPQSLFSSNDDYYVDDLHLNVEGHKMMAEWLLSILQSIIKENRS